ncbi:MAG TPA: Smr/MutS family protein [Alphaproteobacteria bacterium]|nr:Smr/MutS family protein [Alphaproteobacteria bacterium]
MKDKLTPEEIRLWKLNVKDVKPLSKKVYLQEKLPSLKKPIPQKPPSPPSKKLVKSTFPIVPLQDFGRRELRHVRIDARFDMHGMSLENGYEALERFLIRAQERGYKKVLIITGKGSLKAENTLRHQLPRWLEETPLRILITGFHHPAKPQDGGPGAYYVGVRKRS